MTLSPLLSQTRAFWDGTPCDAQDGYEARCRYRYGKEPWLQPRLHAIAARHRQILEIGCGQGTDALTLCQRLPPDGSYLGVDLSEASIAEARRAAESLAGRLQVAPRFRASNAENLDFPDDSFECVYSMGVLHHTEDTARAVAEVLRVLAPGGTAYICLYRTLSPKVLAAHALRGLQRGLDALTGRERVLLQLVRRWPRRTAFGTMLDECFGVPVLRSYTRRQVQALFAGFAAVEAEPVGLGLPLVPSGRGVGNDRTPIGYFWFIRACKQ